MIYVLSNELLQNEYKHLYRTESSSSKLYQRGKIHRLFKIDHVHELPIRSIFSNIGTADHNLIQYIAKLSLP